MPQKQASAAVVAKLYRMRCTIEGLFLEVSWTLDAEPKTLAHPRAALFAFCLALVASNAVGLIQVALRAGYGEEAEELSVDQAALGINQIYMCIIIALAAEPWSVFGGMGAEESAASPRATAKAVDLSRYRKTVRGPKKPTPRKVYKNGGHVSAHKALLDRET